MNEEEYWIEAEAYLREKLKCEDYEFPCPNCGGHWVTIVTRSKKIEILECPTCKKLQGKIDWIDKIKLGIK